MIKSEDDVLVEVRDAIEKALKTAKVTETEEDWKIGGTWYYKKMWSKRGAIADYAVQEYAKAPF
jgi:hypothetical protein